MMIDKNAFYLTTLSNSFENNEYNIYQQTGFPGPGKN
jgi:hypothetical protein